MMAITVLFSGICFLKFVWIEEKIYKKIENMKRLYFLLLLYEMLKNEILFHFQMISLLNGIYV